MCVCVVVVSALRHDHDDDGSNGEIVVREEVSIDHRSSSPSQLTTLEKVEQTNYVNCACGALLFFFSNVIYELRVSTSTVVNKVLRRVHSLNAFKR